MPEHTPGSDGPDAGSDPAPDGVADERVPETAGSEDEVTVAAEGADVSTDTDVDADTGVDTDSDTDDEGDASPDPDEPPTMSEPARSPGRGACPLCGLEFEGRETFRDHLADVHGLVDDEGKETDFRAPVLYAPPPPAEPAPGPTETEALSRRQEPPELGRPTGWLLLVLLLVGVGVGIFVFLPPGDDGDSTDEVAEVDTDLEVGESATTTTAPPGSSSADTSVIDSMTGSAPSEPTPTTVAAQVALATAAPPPPPPVTQAPPPPPPPPPAPTTTAPPPAAFVAPTTTGATIDDCQKGNPRVVTFRWRFVGGASWRPLAAYRSLGNGWYQHVVEVKPKTAIPPVQVLTPTGARRNVALQPALTAC